jgi:hypothetical protein
MIGDENEDFKITFANATYPRRKPKCALSNLKIFDVKNLPLQGIIYSGLFNVLMNCFGVYWFIRFHELNYEC